MPAITSESVPTFTSEARLIASVTVLTMCGVAIWRRIAAVSGAVMTILMWSASLPPQDDVFMDNHIIYALVLVGLALVGAGNTLGLGRWWTQTSVVRRFPWLT